MPAARMRPPPVVVLAGGRGTRLGRLADVAPKPLVEVGGRPIIWHILQLYAAAGIRDAIIAAGYQWGKIQQYFDGYPTVRVVNTGLSANTGGRLRRLVDHLPDTFCLTYGDGLSNVRIRDVIDFHRQHGLLATVTAIQPPTHFGFLSLTGDQVTNFAEKSHVTESWINGGFMVLQRSILDWISDDASSLEHDVLTKLAVEGQLMAFRHDGFWQCMDTPNDVEGLNNLWNDGAAPWRTW